MKKLFAMLLAVVMVLGLVACTVENPGNTTSKPDVPGNTTTQPNTTTTEPDLYYNKTGLPICDEVITIKVAGTVGNTTDWNNTHMVKWIEENLGIKMVCETFSTDVRETKYGLWLSNPEEMPDLVLTGMGSSMNQVNADGADGFWLDMAEYKELMPNVMAFWEEYPALADYCTTADGNIYALTRITTPNSSKINDQIYYHIPTLEAAGVDGSKIKTVDDLYDALVKVKAKYPDKIPYLVTPDVEPAYRNELNLRTAFGVYSNNNSYMVDMLDADGKVVLGDITDQHREYLKFMAKLQKEGLIDITDVTRNKDDIRTDIKAGKYVFFTKDLVPFTEAETKLNDAKDYTWRENFGIIAALTSEKVTESTYIANNGVLAQARTYINAETEYPEAIVRLIDYFHSEEGQVFAVAGEEGVNFKWKVNDLGIKTTDYEPVWTDKNYETASAWHVQTAVINQGFAYNWGFIGAIDSLSEADRAKVPVSDGNYWTLRKLDACLGADNYMLANAVVVFTPEQNEEAGNLPNDLMAFLPTAKIEFINGTRDINNDADWNAFVKQVKDMGWDKLLPIYQEALGE